MVIERQLAKRGRRPARASGARSSSSGSGPWKREAKDTIQSPTEAPRLLPRLEPRAVHDGPGPSRAVRHAFVTLYRDGLIYRGRYVVNWCPRCGTAVSDLEVVDRKTRGHALQDPLRRGRRPWGAVVATTRPETMLGDTALAIHPEDPRTANLRGKTAVLPIVGRELPVVEDAILVDREFGTGIVKVTPAHDANDFASGQRHGLPAVVVIGPDGKMTSEAGEYAGLDRFEARKRIVERLEEEGRLVARSRTRSTLGTLPALRHGDRALPLDAVVRQGRSAGRAGDRGGRGAGTCALRRRPGPRPTSSGCATSTTGASRASSGGVTASRPSPATTAMSPCRTRTRPPAPVCGLRQLEQDPDVLDTWFSSQLWPFSVFGWPDETTDLAEFYPTDVLVTGYDILFFWVARMIMAGLHFTGKAPFHTVHLHGLVRVGGEKMSKTKGNVIDPLEAIERVRRGRGAVHAGLRGRGRTDRFGRARADGGLSQFRDEALERGALHARAARGQDAPENLRPAAPCRCRTAGSCRALPRRPRRSTGNSRPSASTRRRRRSTASSGTSSATGISRWSSRCSTAGRPRNRPPNRPPAERKRSRAARAVLHRCLAGSLALLHPFMPFLTEEIWEKLTGRPGTLIVAPVSGGRPGVGGSPKPRPPSSALRAVVTRVRNFRSERGASPTEPVALSIDRGLARQGADPGAPRARPAPDAPGAPLGAASSAPPAPGVPRTSSPGLSLGLGLARPARRGRGRPHREGARGRRRGDRRDPARSSATLPSSRRRPPPSSRRSGGGWRAPGKARGALGRRGVIPFAGGWLDPEPVARFQNLACCARRDPVLQRAGAGDHRALLRRGAGSFRTTVSRPRRSRAPTAETERPGRRRAGQRPLPHARPARRGGRAPVGRADRRGPLARETLVEEGARVNRAQVAQRSLRRPAQARRRARRSRARRARTRTSPSASASTSERRPRRSASPTRRRSRKRPGVRFELAPAAPGVLDRFDRELAAPRWDEEVRAWEGSLAHRPGDRLTVRSDGEEITGDYVGLDPPGSCASRRTGGRERPSPPGRWRHGEAPLPAGEARCSPSTSATRTPCSASARASELVRHWRLTTRRDATADEIALSVAGCSCGSSAVSGDGPATSSSRASCRPSSFR